MKGACVLLAGVLATAGCATTDPESGRATVLRNAPVRILSVEPAVRRMEILKAVEVDPEIGEETSRFAAAWTDETTFVSTEERESFCGVEGPVVVDFHGIRAADAEALAAGRPFAVRVAIVLPDLKEAEGVVDHNKVVAWFTPDAGEAPRAGTIEVNGKPVRVTMRERNERIYIRKRVAAEDVRRGYWSATMDAHLAGGRIVIEQMALAPKEDPVGIDDPELPRVLVVGDSISMNYHEAARRALKGTANYYRIDGNSGSTVDAVRNLDMWLGDYTQPRRHWDLIQFNSGLHDMKQKVLRGPYAVPIDQYKANLRREIAILKKTGAALIWCSTTPVQNDSGSANYAFRTKGAEKAFNAAALEVMREYPEIRINDLGKMVNESKTFDEWRRARDVHFYRPEEQAALGKAVADAVRQAMGDRQIESEE
jgi:hypothetical protein